MLRDIHVILIWFLSVRRIVLVLWWYCHVDRSTSLATSMRIMKRSESRPIPQATELASFFHTVIVLVIYARYVYVLSRFLFSVFRRLEFPKAVYRNRFYRRIPRRRTFFTWARRSLKSRDEQKKKSRAIKTTGFRDAFSPNPAIIYLSSYITAYFVRRPKRVFDSRFNVDISTVQYRLIRYSRG